jgi:hypothetical protein
MVCLCFVVWAHRPTSLEMPGPPEDYTPWLGRWTGAGTSPPYKIEQDKFEALLALQGFPYAFVKLVQQFATVRIMELDEARRFHFASKMLTGSFSWLYADEPTVRLHDDAPWRLPARSVAFPC